MSSARPAVLASLAAALLMAACGSSRLDAGPPADGGVDQPPVFIAEAGGSAADASSALLCAVTTCPPGTDTCPVTDPFAPAGSTTELCGTNLLAERTNCGACGVECPDLLDPFSRSVQAPLWAASNCVAGTCTLVCASPAHRDCNGAAEDGCETSVETDAKNCGGCGNLCPGGLECLAGACGCPPGKTACDDPNVPRHCVDPQNDVEHCGQCGNNIVGSNFECKNGKRACPVGQIECVVDGFAGCVDPKTDDANCGGCGMGCPVSTTWTTPPHMYFGCVNGTCGRSGLNPPTTPPPARPAPPPLTNLKCVPPDYANDWQDCNASLSDGCEADLASNDPKNCGSCGVACAAGAACINPTGLAQQCGCQGGLTYCRVDSLDLCIDLSSDINNCGTCGNRCEGLAPGDSAAAVTGRPTCDRGICGYECVDGWGDCNGVRADGCETNLRISSAHCGGCGQACAAASAQPCVNGSCLVGPCDGQVTR